MKRQQENDTITIDPVKLVAVRNGQELELSLTELRVLSIFLTNRGKVLNRQQIFDHARMTGTGQFSNIVDVYINYLRQHLGKDVIITIRGIGYCFGPVEHQEQEAAA